MKSILWKIGAAATIMLGSLGPHVAHGSWTEAQTTIVQEPSGSGIEVVSYDSGTSVKVVQSAQCGESVFNIERFDLLLWHNCDFGLKLGRISAPQLTVITQLPNLPAVTVLHTEPDQLAGHSEFWTDQTKAAAAFINPTVPTVVQDNRSSVPDLFHHSGFIEEISAATDSTQRYIVMRC